MNEASAYYAQARLGLGESFLAEVQHAVDSLAASPLARMEVENGVRWWLVRRFPYSVIYLARVDHLRVLAIAHQKRRPFYWRGRR